MTLSIEHLLNARKALLNDLPPVLDQLKDTNLPQDNTGGSLRLVNKAQTTSEYIAITRTGAPIVGIQPFLNRQLAWDMCPEAHHLIQIDKTDGVVTGVGVLKRK